MKQSLWFTFIIAATLLLITSCDKEVSTTNPELPPPYNGKLIFNSDPQGAKIIVNGNNIGKVTPDSMIFVEPGQYDIRYCYYPFIDMADSAYLQENGTVLFFLNFMEDERNFGYIECLSDPEGSLIFLNDSCTNLYTPDTLKFIWPGDYKISLTYPDHREDSTFVTMLGNSQKQVSIVLQDTSDCVDYNVDNSGFEAGAVSGLYIDEDNYKWASTHGGGVIKFKENSTTLFNSQTTQMQSSDVSCVVPDKQGRLWAGTFNGLVMIDEDENVHVYDKDNSGIPATYINSVAVGNDGIIWIGTGSPRDEKCLIRFDGYNWDSYPAEQIIWALTVDHDNKVWVGTNWGLQIFEEGELHDINEGLPPDHKLRTHPIESLLTDNEGKVWIGAAPAPYGLGLLKGGLFVADSYGISEFALPENLISNIDLAPNGDKWISVYGVQPFYSNSWYTIVLMKITPDNDVISYRRNFASFPTSRFTCAVEDRYGNLWLGSADKGLIKYKNGALR